jgi:hypothetical protein
MLKKKPYYYTDPIAKENFIQVHDPGWFSHWCVFN